MRRFYEAALVLALGCTGSACGAEPSGSKDAGAGHAAVATGGRSASATGGRSAGATTGGAGAASAGTGGGRAGTSGSGGARAGTAGTSSAGSPGALPDGDTGIAAKYPGDVGIESDSAVIFADGFEDYAQVSDLSKNWDAFYQQQDIRFASESENVFAGKQSIEFTIPQQTAELSDATDKLVKPERDLLFLRYYSKFQPPYDVVGSSHNGASISAHYFMGNQATPGVPANGTNKFLVNYEDWRGEASTPSPGPLNVYVYHPEQRSEYGDHFFATGMVLPNTSIHFDFGPDFVARPDVTPELGRWYCYEYMVKANTPGKRDGRIAFWLDGKLLADFGNLRFRDLDTLKIDRFGISFHIGSNPNGVSKKWYDAVVAASEYIGPMAGK